MTASSICFGQEDKTNGEAEKTAKAEKPFEMSREVAALLNPFFESIRKASVSRATVELAAETIVDGAVVDTQTSTYQIASKAPAEYTIYLKETERRTRIYNDGKQMSVALAPDAYVHLSETQENQAAVFQLPVTMGPYPEAVLALTLAGVDPSLTLATGMKSMEIVDRDQFRGRTDAIHFRGVQDDNVAWDFWITQGDDPKPLRLIVDLTEMLRANGELEMPAGYQYQLRFDFLSWRVTGSIDTKMFQFSPEKDATKYETVEAYYTKLAEEASRYPLLGKVAPQFRTKTADDKDFDSADLKGKIQVINFWATNCDGCIDNMSPVIEMTKKYAAKGVVHVPVDVGEPADLINDFVKQKGWEIQPLLDTESKIASGFGLLTIPMVIVIGNDGVVEAAYPGLWEPKNLAEQLEKDLDVLVQGKHLIETE
ncbi:Thiol-disulfide oxidoreductase ResA [Stieleria varia]|uniref:Thiol-disulfide oxidoreductase ResA n=2 Tax=Stieleria varia TaxID=2528005 RepID=A0A5C6B993_9BACT|nr:Thiol-disulfide oxidoreductase ResA [Stieleria varia]